MFELVPNNVKIWGSYLLENKKYLTLKVLISPENNMVAFHIL